jgi:hypothetical protein
MGNQAACFSNNNEDADVPNNWDYRGLSASARWRGFVLQIVYNLVVQYRDANT